MKRRPRRSDHIPRPGRKLDVLNGECDKCGRRGRYHLYRLIERYGAKLFDWSNEITADTNRGGS